MRLRWSPLVLVIGLVLSACGGAPVAQAPSHAPSASAAPTTAPTTAPTAAPTTEPTVAPTAAPTTLNNEAIAEKLRPSTVRVIAEFGETAIDQEGLGAGTGVVYDLDNGYIITNAHVVEGASAVKIAPADTNKTRSARVVGRSQCDDLAVLKIDNTDGMQAAKLGESSEMKVGAEVVAMGYPLSFELGSDVSINAGSISQLKAQLGKYENLIKIDAAINPGNSGGPLVNRKGEVIGINSLGLPGAQNQNYAIAMSQAKPIIKQLEQGKNRNYIGLNLVPNDYKDYFGTDQGMAIIGVASGSPASQAGIQPADLLLKMEGTAITSDQQVCDILRSRADGDQIKVQILRAGTGEVLEGELTIGKVGAADDKTAKLAVVGNVGTGNQAGGDQGRGGEQQGNQGGEQASEPAASTDEALVVNNSFDNGDNGSWPVGQEDGYSANVADGAYTLDLQKDNLYLFLGPDEATNVADGAIAARVRPEGTGLAGVMVRSSEANGARSMYVCWISNGGKFACSKDVNNTWTVIVQPKASDAIKPNDNNVILLSAIGNQFSFEINDKEVASFTDDTLKTGAWGVYAETTPGNFKVRYDQVAIYKAN